MTDSPVRQRRWWLAPAAAALIGATAACGSIPANQPAAAASAPPSSAGAAPAEAQPLDACALLTTEEIVKVIGARGGTDPQATTASDGGSSCVWENPDTYHSITLGIGGPGTAVGGNLPEDPYVQTELGPDGIRFGSGGVARFATLDRACEIQVVTNLTGDSARSTTVRLIGLIRDRV